MFSLTHCRCKIYIQLMFYAVFSAPTEYGISILENVCECYMDMMAMSCKGNMHDMPTKSKQKLTILLYYYCTTCHAMHGTCRHELNTCIFPFPHYSRQFPYSSSCHWGLKVNKHYALIRYL